MRDDLVPLFHELQILLDKKIIKLDNLLLSETDKLYALKSKNTSKLTKLFDDNEKLINEIDIIDFDCMQLIEKATAILGIKSTEFLDFLKENTDEKEFKKTIALLDMIDNKLKEIISKRDEIIDAMEKESMEITRDLESLKNVKRLQGNYKKKDTN